FDNFQDFFDYNLKEGSTDQNGKKIQTLQELALKLGYSSPSTLSMVAKSNRHPSSSLLESLIQEWKTGGSERERIRLNVEIERRQRKGLPTFNLATRFNSLSQYKKIDLTGHHLVRDWYVLVVKLLVATGDFIEDSSRISRQLRKKITPKQATYALELLERSGMICRDPVSNKLRQTVESTETTHEISSEAIRANHHGMLSRAIEALEEQPIERRQFNSLALQFDSKNMPAAKRRLLDFIKEFHSEFGTHDSNEIYQLNVQFFEHTSQGCAHEN
ncbi:MAG: TIGR02147 family protein, partial [Bdellovibrionales bacterium]|nr:TIGR02147 family protein [Bdellovibrionales bacterium]